MVAAPYFTTAEFRSLMSDMDEEARYPDVQVEAARNWAEALIERFCRTSFVARTTTETLDGGDWCLVLSTPFVQSVTSVTIAGVLLTGYDYSYRGGVLERRPTGTYSYPTVWTFGRRNIVVVYEAGYSAAPPNDLKLAAMQATRDRVIRMSPTSGSPSERATSITNDIGGTTQFATAGVDRPTGLPDADAVIVGWRDETLVNGVA